MMSNLFTLGDLIVVGLAADIAGAVILALSFSTKSPEQMRKEVPTRLSVPNIRPSGGDGGDDRRRHASRRARVRVARAT